MHSLTIIAALNGKPGESWAFLLAVAVATTVMVLLTRRRIKRNMAQGLARRRAPRASALSRQAPIQSEIHEVMIELEKLARHVNAQIDTKFLKLEAVIRDADQRIAELERLSTGRGGRTVASDGVDITIGDMGQHSSGLDPRAVHKLMDAGLSPTEIARELGRSRGEIDLILAMRRQSAGMPT